MTAQIDVLFKKNSKGFTPHLQPEYIPKTTFNTYPMCCGACIITGFGFYAANRKEYENILTKDIEYWTEKAFQERYGLILCIFNHNQMQKGDVHRVMTSQGFVLQLGVGNPKYENQSQIFLYVKTVSSLNIKPEKVSTKKNTPLFSLEMKNI